MASDQVEHLEIVPPDPFLYEVDGSRRSAQETRAIPTPILRIVLGSISAIILSFALFGLVISLSLLLLLALFYRLEEVGGQSSRGGPEGSSREKKATSSDVAFIKSFIPDDVDRKTFGKLAALLGTDWEESAQNAGYIYVFWQTTNDEPPSRELARSFTDRYDRRWKFQESLRQRYSAAQRKMLERKRNPSSPMSPSVRFTTPGKGEMFVKLGFTENVTDLKAWASHCKRDITLLLFYHSGIGRRGQSVVSRSEDVFENSTYSSSMEDTAANLYTGLRPDADGKEWEQLSRFGKLPFARYVEQLIHDEFEHLQVPKACDCTKNGNEWYRFQVSKESIETIDECVSRWIRWTKVICQDREAHNRQTSLSPSLTTSLNTGSSTTASTRADPTISQAKRKVTRGLDSLKYQT